MHDANKRQRLSSSPPIQQKGIGGHRQGFDGPLPEDGGSPHGDHVHEPSLVVHVRGLPDGVVEGELRAAVSSFGPVAFVLLIPRKRQALVEFEQIESAIDCVTYSSKNTIHIRNTAIYFNYSTSERIIRTPFDKQHPVDDPSEMNNILLFTIMNATYPITCEVMYAITSKIAPPVRCVIFRKNGVQSMVEFSSSQDAQRVRMQLNGADIYSGCCTLKIEYAKPKKLNVFKNDNDSSWDWANPHLDSGSSRSHPGSGLLPDPRGGSPTFGGPNYGAYGPPSNYSGGGYDYNHSTRPHTSHGYYPSAPGSGSGSSNYDRRSPREDFGDGAPSRTSRSRGDYSTSRSASSHGGPPPPHYGVPPYLGPNRGASSAAAYSPASRLPMQPGCVILIYGLSDRWNCDKLFSLLCMYGNVVRIKFLKSKEGSAMVQLAQVEQVENTIQALSGMELCGSRLNIHHSRQQGIEEFGGRPASLPDLTPAYKDFYKPPYIALQRFSTPESSAKNRLQPPSPVLHFFNAPPNVTEDQLLAMLHDCGSPRPSKVRMLQGKSEKSSSGLLQFDSTDQAVEALLTAQHQPFYIPGATSKPPYTLKLCFSSMQA